MQNMEGQFGYEIYVMNLVEYALCTYIVFFFKQKTAYEVLISDWSSDVCSSDLLEISNDLGTTFNVIGSFVEYDIARSFGDAWVEGRIEKAGACSTPAVLDGLSAAG